jgi:ketosteroid isomerase-like protein
MADSKVTTASLQAFLDAFNAHDVDEVISFFTEDCVFDMPRGPAPGGRRLIGRQQVREGIQSRFDGIPDIHYGDDRHWTCGNRGV